jgi:predicted transcriptional regulator with HTH domain
MTQKLPLARNESVAVQELGKETLIYDFKINKAYCLNETSSVVYRHCNGKTSFEELKRRYKYTDDLVYLALDELQKNDLIKSEKITHFAGMNRREVIRRVGLASLVALPLVTGLAAPHAAHAASSCPVVNESCNFDNFAQSNCCTTDLRCGSPVGGAPNTCQTCGSGFPFFIVGDGGTATVADCNARPERNFCCDTATSASANGSACLCPGAGPVPV